MSIKNERKYRAFISYSHKDKQFAKWLHRKIENYKIPKSLREKYPHLPIDLKRSIFRDEEELPISSVLSNNILYALDNSELLIVVCSPSAATSKWVNKEIAYFKNKNGENAVLAIIKDGEPNATYGDEPNNEAFPEALRYIIGEDQNPTNEKCEPLAGDARGYWNKEMAFVKMVAGVLKVDFADLWEREKREKNKRKMITGVILSIFVALSFYASIQFVGNSTNIELERINHKITSINYSIRHDNLPVEQVIALNKELKELEELKKAKEETQKSLGNLKTPLGQKAKEVYNEKGAKAAIDILTSRDALSRKEQLKKELSLEEISLAKLYVETNEYEKAQQSYEDAINVFFDFDNVIKYIDFLKIQQQHKKAIQLSNKLLKEKLPDEQVAEILNVLGSLNQSIKRYIEAEKFFLEALQKNRVLSQKNPSTSNDGNFAAVLNNLGILYSDTKRYDEAEKFYLESLQINRSFVQKNPNAYDELAAILNNLALLYAHTNRYDEAEKFYLEALSIRRALAQENPSAFNPVLALSLNNLAKSYNNAKRYDEAEKFYLESLQIYKSLVKQNPDAFNEYLAVILHNLAFLYYNTNRYDKAEKLYLETLQINRALAQKNPNVYNNELVSVLNNLAFLYYNTKHYDNAEKLNLEVLQFRRALAQENPSAFNPVLALSLHNLAFLYYEIKRYDEAEKFYLESLQIFKSLTKQNPDAYNEYLDLTLNNVQKLYKATNQMEKLKKINNEIATLNQPPKAK